MAVLPLAGRRTLWIRCSVLNQLFIILGDGAQRLPLATETMQEVKERAS